jgi:regulation of enolase protein 1 (concanavalin A-like superfamily)
VGKEGKLNRQVIFDERERGKRGTTLNQAAPDGPVYLRLERKNGVVTGAFSGDGKEWSTFKTIDAQWSRGVADVGVVAVNTSTVPHTVRFEDYSLKAK